MEPDPETQRKISIHFAISTAIARIAHDLLPIEAIIKQDLEFYESWMTERTEAEKNEMEFFGESPQDLMLKLLKAARDLAAAHRSLMTYGEMIVTGTEDTGKYKM